MSNYLVVGCFGSSYGVQGWIKVRSFTHPQKNIVNFPIWLIADGNIWSPLTIAQRRCTGKDILVKILGCDTPEDAKKYTNLEIAIERELLPQLKQDEYYWTDLQGLHVSNQDGVDFGVVTGFLATGSNDVMIVMGERKRLIPYLSKVIKSVNLDAKKIVVDWDPDY